MHNIRAFDISRQSWQTDINNCCETRDYSNIEAVVCNDLLSLQHANVIYIECWVQLKLWEWIVLTYLVFVCRLYHCVYLISKGLVLNFLCSHWDNDLMYSWFMSMSKASHHQLTWVLRDCPDWLASSVACLEVTITFWLRELTSYNATTRRAQHQDCYSVVVNIPVLSVILSHHSLKFFCGILLDARHIFSCEPISDHE